MIVVKSKTQNGGNEMSKHTPGPWVAKSPFSQSTGAVEITHETWRNNSQPITRVYRRLTPEQGPDGRFQWDDVEAQANADLIRSAPELLEALERLMGTIDIQYRDTHPAQREAWWHAQEVIKKVTG